MQSRKQTFLQSNQNKIAAYQEAVVSGEEAVVLNVCEALPAAPAAEPPASELCTALCSCHPERVHRSNA